MAGLVDLLIDGVTSRDPIELTDRAAPGNKNHKSRNK